MSATHHLSLPLPPGTPPLRAMRAYRNPRNPRTPLRKILQKLATRDITLRPSESLSEHDAASGDQESFVREVPCPSTCCEGILQWVGEDHWRCGSGGEGEEGERVVASAGPGDREEEGRVVGGDGETGREETEEGRGER